MHHKHPFWESSYRLGDEASTFGPPSAEIVALAKELDGGARVLDLGCGDGRNALHLARNGFRVTAIDMSEAAIGKLTRSARKAKLSIRTDVADMRAFRFPEDYDLIVAHGCLHLLTRPEWNRVIARMKEHTNPGGHNVVAVFTDRLPPPPDLEPFHLGLFREGELFEHYRDWEILQARGYLLEDEHPGGIRHRHPIDKLVAKRTSGEIGAGDMRPE